MSAKGSVESALREPFVALDSEAAPGAVEWIRAGARQAEAGFEDPALGWIGVRAELSGGGVHAALVPGSADAAEQLGRQMDGLHAYLAEQRTPVDSLVMAAPVRSSADSGSGGFGHGAQHQMGQGTEHGASQNTPERASRGAESNSVPGRPEAGRASVAQAASAVHGTDMYTPSGRGAHISLMA